MNLFIWENTAIVNRYVYWTMPLVLKDKYTKLDPQYLDPFGPILVQMADLDQNLDFDPLKNHEKSKSQKSPLNVFISAQNLSPNQISA